MTFGRPWALAFLAVPPVLLWLRMRALRPREAEASSLLVWRKVAAGEAAPDRPRPPLAAWVEALGAALVALALADPALPGAVPGEVRVLLDASPSMHARGPDGRTRIGEARETVSKYDTMNLESTDPARDLPGLLLPGSPLVVVTDRPLPGFPDDPPRLRVVGVGGPAFNAGITAAAGEPIGEGRWRVFLAVEAAGAAGPVEGTLSLAGREERITVPPGTPLEVARDIALPPGGAAKAEIRFEGDTLPDDDRVDLAPAGGDEVLLGFASAFRSNPLLRALEAAGAVPSNGPRRPLALALSSSGRPPLIFELPLEAEGPAVAGAGVVATDHRLVRDVRVDPTVTLGRRGEPLPSGDDPPTGEGTPLLLDDAGPLVLLREGGSGPVLRFRFLPGGTWAERDPSFVVLARNLVEYAAGGPPRLEAAGVLDPEETACSGAAFGDLESALRGASSPDPGTRTPLAAPLLLAAALLFAAAWHRTR